MPLLVRLESEAFEELASQKEELLSNSGNVSKFILIFGHLGFTRGIFNFWQDNGRHSSSTTLFSDSIMILERTFV